jgi:hypothetical protein
MENAITREFTKKENALVKMIGWSSFNMPYHIHPPTPINNINNIKKERSPAFFSFINLINCGSMDMAVKIPDTTPTYNE